MQQAELSPRTQSVEDEVVTLRDALLQFGSKFNLLARATADHDPRPPQAPHQDLSMESITLSRLLDSIHKAWDPEDLAEDEMVLGPMEFRRMRALNRALLNFGFSVGREGTGQGLGTTLFTCNCSDDGCPARNPRSLTTHDLLEVVETGWHGLSGCRGGCRYPVDPRITEAVNEVLVRNLALLRVFNERLQAEQDEDWEDVLIRHTLLKRTYTYDDFLKMQSHGIDSHVKGRHSLGEIQTTHRLIHQIPIRRGWDAETTLAFAGAVGNAADALLLRDIEAPVVFDTLYDAVNPKIPVAEIHVALAQMTQGATEEHDSAQA